MAAPMDSDEEDSFVTLGTPLEVFEDDEARKKPVSVHDLPAKDSRGRPRFHGAFTGGFSAGFFNTVGSKEGFQPSSFVSSRSAKEEKVQQRPEDFMDDEDFSEHGIAPRKLATSSTYTSEERGLKRKAMAVAVAGSSVIPGAAAALSDLIVPESLPIGVQLLRKMGWKEGQGIGPRERRKKKTTKVKTKSEKRLIGCALPPSDDSDEESDEVTLRDVTFAPKDKNPVSLKAKDNVHGLGYSGLDPKSALPSGHINLFQAPPVKGKSQKGIKGQAFGVGALEDDDDDIYAVDHLSNYDMTMGLEDHDNKFGWTAPGQNRKGKQRVPIGYVGKLLEGFQLSSKPLKTKKVFKPPVLPAAFRPVHRFLKPCDSLTPNADTEKHNAVSRGVVLGETPIFKSVFDLIPKDDLKKVEKAKEIPGPKPMSATQSSSDHHRTSRFSAPVAVSEPDSKETDRQTEPVSHQSPTQGESSSTQSKSLFQGSLAFEPFARDSAKQRRYDKYISQLKHGNKDPYEEVAEGHMTEWEREREKEEFVRAAKLYRPLSAMMATRFTTAKFADDQDKVDAPAESEGQKSDQAKAAEMKMFGRLTRDECDWYPDKLLCRRFNVPNPYPGSTIVGLPTVKRDKYSVFNFLEFPGNQTANFYPPDQVLPQAIEYPDPPSQEPTTSVQPTKNPAIKSFTVGSSKSGGVRPALGSIFSVLYEDDEKKQKAKQNHMEEEKIPESVTAQKLQPTSDNLVPTSEGHDAPSDDAPSLDLFRAIFKNSDSEDTSESEKEEDEKTSKPVAMETAVTESAGGGGGDGLNQDPEKSQAKGDTDSSVQYLPGAPVAMETLEARLTPPVSDKPQSDDEMAYGPALPPPSTSAVTSSAATSSPVTDLTYSEHRKQKHKYKDKESRKHKHKKEKKAKNKRSKHKKKERKKKKDRQRKSSSDEDGSQSSDSESDARQPSDRELLNRLKAVGGGRLKAADFM